MTSKSHMLEFYGEQRGPTISRVLKFYAAYAAFNEYACSFVDYTPISRMTLDGGHEEIKRFVMQVTMRPMSRIRDKSDRL